MTVLNFDFSLRIAGTVPCGKPEEPFDDIRAEEGEHFFPTSGFASTHDLSGGGERGFDDRGGV
jgi:hypothetical protein